MKTRKNTLFMLLCTSFICMVLCVRNKSSPLEPQPCINDQPVEDTTRVWLHPITRDTLTIYPKAVYARFYPWVTDTVAIRQLAEKHNLRIYAGPQTISQQLAAILCVPDNRRTEYHFTPYGKEGFCNFGSDSLVEYAFCTFGDGHLKPTGNLIFKFEDGTPQTKIDSLFEANGLRLLYVSPDYPSGHRYWTIVTPFSKKNVLDLGYELQFVSFVFYVSTEMATGGGRIDCDDGACQSRKSLFTK